MNEKFNKASSCGIPIEIKSVTQQFLQEHLANHGNIILLTNASLLYCDLCKANKLSIELRYEPFLMGDEREIINLCRSCFVDRV